MKQMISTQNLNRLITASAFVLALQYTPAMGQPGVTGSVREPRVPSIIEAPAGHRTYLKGHAVGTQNYVCLPSGWTFLGPQATLFVTFPWINGEARQQITTHYLSANAAEGGIARPTWQSSLDTSAVWAKVKSSSTDASFAAPGAIPWLLLEVVGSQRGPMGGSFLSQTTFVQRVNTSGGITPATACNVVGSTALVPYTADYFFYKAAR